MPNIRWKEGLTFNKDPDDILDYVFDFTEFLGDENIVTATALAENMTAEIQEFSEKTATLRVSAGVEGQKGTATVRITTTTGRQTDRSLTFRFKQR